MTETPGFTDLERFRAPAIAAGSELSASLARVTHIFESTAALAAAAGEQALLAAHPALGDPVLEPCSACHGTGMVIDVFADVDPDPCLECEGAGAFDVYGRPTSCR